MKLRNKKTGEVVVCGEGIIEFKTFGCKNLAEFLEAGWEDYELDEPLIKDEKIRKVVRAWAEVCGLSYVTYKQASNEFYDPDTRGAFAIRFRLIPVEVCLEDGECYTIAELCGEEEECES